MPSLLPHAAREILEIHLVHDAVAGRDDANAFERLLAPLQERVALAVALELELHVALDRVRPAAHVDFDRVVDDEIDRHERLDASRVAAEVLRRRAHRGEIVERGKARHVLKQDAREHERNLRRALAVGLPRRELAHVFLGDAFAVAIAQHGLEHDPQAVGHAGHFAEPCRFERGERVVMTFPAAMPAGVA